MFRTSLLNVCPETTHLWGVCSEESYKSFYGLLWVSNKQNTLEDFSFWVFLEGGSRNGVHADILPWSKYSLWGGGFPLDRVFQRCVPASPIPPCFTGNYGISTWEHLKVKIEYHPIYKFCRHSNHFGKTIFTLSLNQLKQLI